MSIKPILFNTDMVLAIMQDMKTETRRTVKPQHLRVLDSPYRITHPDVSDICLIERLCVPPCKVGDILYVRETWAFKCRIDCLDNEDDEECMLEINPVIHEDKDSVSEGCYVYRAGYPCPERVVWHPSIHMPKQAARIWLKVKDVRVERLQEMRLDDFLNEGIVIRPEAFNDPENAYWQARDQFSWIWNSTLKKSDLTTHGWDANPLVWAIKFERCGKPEGEG